MALARAIRRLLAALLAVLATIPAAAQDPGALYRYDSDGTPRWASPENPRAEKSGAARENRRAKGHAFESIAPGASLDLARIEGPGIIDRMWLTIMDRSPEMLRALRLDIWWDGAATPAVSVPLGDFFLAGAGQLVAMDTALIASPEGRSFLSYIPMPFRRGARITVTNESSRPLHQIYWDVDFRRLTAPIPDALYFHASWRRERATALGRDFELLPRVAGRGRFLGAAVSVLTDPAYGTSWWGEGEVKLFLDGDGDDPTLAGTGTEDYVGSGWGQGAYVNRFQGSPVADEARGRWSFYRFHIPDPIFFSSDVRVTLQQIGGAMKADVEKMLAAGVSLRPLTIAAGAGNRASLVKLLELDKPVSLDGQPDGWTNFYRSDDVSAVAYFYLDRPENGLPPLAVASDRTAALRAPAP